MTYRSILIMTFGSVGIILLFLLTMVLAGLLRILGFQEIEVFKESLQLPLPRSLLLLKERQLPQGVVRYFNGMVLHGPVSSLLLPNHLMVFQSSIPHALA